MKNFLSIFAFTVLTYFTLQAQNTVKIGDQEWMTENLSTASFANGDLIRQAQSNADWAKADSDKKPAWCYYDNDGQNGPKHGKLYNWYAVKSSKNVCPTGFHAPRNKEWKQLVETLGKKTAGAAMKATTGWNKGTNSSGFNAVPSGQRRDNGEFGYKDRFVIYWSTFVANAYTASKWALYTDNEKLEKGSEFYGYGYSVRCLKD